MGVKTRWYLIYMYNQPQSSRIHVVKIELLTCRQDRTVNMSSR